MFYSTVLNLFRYCGFGQAITFKTITDSHIDEVEKFIREQMLTFAPVDSIREDFFGPVFAKNPSRFVFLPGHKSLIKELVSHVKHVVDRNGTNAGLNYFKISNKSSEIRPARDSITRVEEKNTTRAHYFLDKLMSAANRNADRKKGGYRYDKDIQLFSIYLRLIVGKLGYQTIQKNLEAAIPSLPTIDRYIRSSHFHITPGILRTQELLQYLNERDLPKIVSISEDMTRIVGRVQYDSRTNQLYGLVEPINYNTGMPIPFCFPARSADEMMKHFANGKASGYLNVLMVQPIAKNASPFCLLLYGSDNKFTANAVVKRWEYIVNELEKVGITVLTISSDSDPRYNSAMRELSSIGKNTCKFAKWFSCSQSTSAPFCVQDMVHIITKMRNFFLRTKWTEKKLPFGNHSIDIAHLYVLLYKYSKDKHLLTETVLNPADRQNFSSAEKMCSAKVTDLLNVGVDGAEATSLYLQMMRNIMSAFMDPDLTPIQRIRAIWFPVFIMRIWRQYIVAHKQYTLKDNFMTTNCYCCVELNAHALILLIIHLKGINRPELFLPELFESQACESTFRQFRSLSSTYSTVTNCTLKEACARISKIQMQNEIIHATSDEFAYPRLKKKECAKTIKFELPSKQEIFTEIEQCQKDAISTAKQFGLITKRCKTKTYVCNLKSLKTKVKRVKITEASSNQREDIALLDLGNIQLKDYTGKLKNTVIDESSPYVEIFNDDGERMIFRKISLCWLLQEDCQKLSSDRLIRVRNAVRKPHSQARRNPKKKFKQEIYKLRSLRSHKK